MQLRIGNRLVEVDMVNGVPTIKVDAEEIHNSDGSVDVIVHVPCMTIGTTRKATGMEVK